MFPLRGRSAEALDSLMDLAVVPGFSFGDPQLEIGLLSGLVGDSPD